MNVLRYLFVMMLVCCTAVPTLAQTNKSIKSLQREQKTLKKDIAEQEKMLRSTKKDVTSQLANLQVISAQIEGQQKYVDGIHSEITALSGNIRNIEQQLKLLEKDLYECKRKYRHAVTYMFRNRMRFAQWQFILSAKNFRQMYRRLRYVNEFSKFQMAQGRIIEQKEAKVRAVRNDLLNKKTEKNRLFEAGKAEKLKLQGQHQERQKVVDELNQKQKQLQASIAKQRKQYARLNERIDKLIQAEIEAAERRRKAEAERRRKAELARQKRLKAQREKAAREAARRKGKSTSKSKSTKKKTQRADEDESTATPNFTLANDVDRILSNNFAANRGRLPMPITGSYAITTHYGQYNVPGLRGVRLDSKGISITGHPGAQARAVFKGEVTMVFTDAGMYHVIVRHGSYLSVYCNLSSTSVRQGQQVSTRQILGNVATDASGNCTLHFQLRKETSKLNPESWLAR